MNLPEGWKVDIATTLEEIEDIRPIWEEFLSHEPYPATNANINRYEAVLRSQKDHIQPYIILFSHQDRPVSILIGRIERHHFKCKIGYWTICSPSLRCLSVIYGGIPGQPSPDVCNKITYQFREILKQRVVDVVFLNHIRTDSNIHQAVRNMTGFLYRSHFKNSQQHWQTLLPYPLDDFKGILSKKHLRDINRCTRNLEKACCGPVEVVCYHQKEDLREFVQVASRISASTYQSAMGQGFVADSLTLSLLNQAKEDGWLRTYVLYAGNEPVAFEYGCVHGDGYFAEVAGFNPRWKAYSPGTILQLEIFKSLSRDDKVVKYDYGFGDATYKQRFGSVSWSETTEYIFAPAPYPIIINLVDSLIRGLSLGMYYLVRKLGLTGNIKRWWRKRIQPVKAKSCGTSAEKGNNIKGISLGSQNNMKIRRANKTDVADILDICKSGFSEIRWHGLSSRGKNWWKVALKSEAADTYVVESDGRIIAFALLVRNEQLWRNEDNLRQGSLITRFLSCILCPRLTAAEIYRRITRLTSITKKFLLKTPVARSYQRTWLEMLAVKPQERRHGIAKLLLQECESQTKALGRDAISLLVTKANEPAIRLYLNMGYEKYTQSNEYDFYIKSLDSIDVHKKAALR